MHALAYGVLFILLIINLRWTRPAYNWDMLAYVSLAYQFSGESAPTAHELTYAEVKKTVAATDYDLLTSGNDYRKIVASDPAAFNQQLPGYRMKLLYPWLLSICERAGWNPVSASVTISRAAYIAIGMIVLAWLASFLAPVPAVLTAWIAMSLAFALRLAQLSTPDALSTAIILCGLWLIFQRAKLRAGLLVIAASIIVRPDNGLWLLAVAAYAAATRRSMRIFSFVVLAAGFVLALLLVRLAGSPHWATVFHHSFIERLPYQDNFHGGVSPLEYLRVLLRETHPANLPPFLLVFALAGAWLLVARVPRFRWSDDSAQIIAVMAGFGALHWLLYPGDDRFFAAAYLAITVVLVRHLAARNEPEPAGNLATD